MPLRRQAPSRLPGPLDLGWQHGANITEKFTCQIQSLFKLSPERFQCGGFARVSMRRRVRRERDGGI